MADDAKVPLTKVVMDTITSERRDNKCGFGDCKTVKETKTEEHKEYGKPPISETWIQFFSTIVICIAFCICVGIASSSLCKTEDAARGVFVANDGDVVIRSQLSASTFVGYVSTTNAMPKAEAKGDASEKK